MNIETLRDYCLSKNGTTESFPFNETTLVFKVMNKIFAFTNLDGDLSVSLKCNPELAVALREKYSFIVPGYHLNKQHWNTIFIDNFISDTLLKQWIDHSYDLIVKSLPKKLQLELESI